MPSDGEKTPKLGQTKQTTSSALFRKLRGKRGSNDSYVSTSDMPVRPSYERPVFPSLEPLEESQQSPYVDEYHSSPYQNQTQPSARSLRRPSESTIASIGTNSPSILSETLVRSPDAMSTSRPSTPSRRMFERGAAGSPTPSRSTTPIQSATRYWNQIRNAIETGAISGPDNPSSPVTATTSVPGTSSSNLPVRPQTPKPSRLARFRQAVDNARSQTATTNERDDGFEMEVCQACLHARIGGSRLKVEKEGSQAAGYLHFMSTTSLNVNGALQIGKGGHFNDYAPPSLKGLHRVLMRYASAGQNTALWRLPYESEVLSALLIPYMIDSRRDMEEQWLAIETFELAVQTWNAPNHQCQVNRLLWCCKAALIPSSPVRSRVLGMLSNMLFSSKPFHNAPPLSLQNLFQALQLVAHTVNKHPAESDADVHVIRELCEHVYNGGCGDLLPKAIAQEYGVEWGSKDTADQARAQVLAEAVVRCMQNGSDELRRWVLHNIAATYWPSSTGPSDLCKAIAVRRLFVFLRSSISLVQWDISQSKPDLLKSDATVILQLVKDNILVDIKQLKSSTGLNDCRSLIILLVLELLEANSTFVTQNVVGLWNLWLNEDAEWSINVEMGVKILVEKVDWPILARILLNVIARLPTEFQRKIITIAISALHMRLALDPGLTTCTNLSVLFEKLAELYPQQFYMPLFALAAASKEPTLVGQLSVVVALARHLHSFWIRDPEMMAIAVMSDASKGKANIGTDSVSPWARLRIGQSLILVELIHCVRELKGQKESNSTSDKTQPDARNFFIGLETRLAVLLEAKESEKLLPFSQRVLLSTLFLEIRLFTRSLKPAPWLSTIVRWASECYIGAPLSFVSPDINPFTNGIPFTVEEENRNEIIMTVQSLRSLYVACQQMATPNSRQRNTLVVSSIVDTLPSAGIVDNFGFVNEAVNERQELLNTIPHNVATATLKLLVAICGLLSHSEYKRLGPVLWYHLLDNADFNVLSPACFLLTHCLERSPDAIAHQMKADLLNAESNVRRKVILRMMTLFAFRSELLAQPYVSDRGHRRPFKLARHPISFVAIDVGSGVYVHEQTEEDRKKLAGGGLPADIRKKLAEAGWDQDEGPTDTRLEKIRAPMSLFSISHFDYLNGVPTTTSSGVSTRATEQKQLLRRKSSGASSYQSNNKRRPVFVPALVSLFPLMAFAAMDSDEFVASFAREILLVVLRDDPNMLCRPVFEAMSTDMSHIGEIMSTLSAFLHTHHRLPPSASHHIFANVAGFLKHISREADDLNALKAFSYGLPLLRKLITQVSSLSIRDLRRAKFEIFVFPSGSLWFPPTAPASSMFPRSLQLTSQRKNEIPEQLVSMCMIRTAQNMLLLDMLKHKPQEVRAVRKALADLVLPGDNTGRGLDARSFLPCYDIFEHLPTSSYEQVSLALSRSYMLLLEEVFRSMPRNTSDRQELARLFDGLSKILLAHGTDLGIVAHAMIACMIGATRFKRFFASGGGFSLFMPSLLKVYAECEGKVGIRQTIQYASSRFYAVHEEAYLFQSLDLASQTLAQLENPRDKTLFAQAIWDLFSSLKTILRSGAPDPAGIHGCNREEEKEVLIAASIADDDLFMNPETSQSDRLKKIMEIEEYDTKVLHLDNLARLFLTIIAHDPTIMRAQNFLVLFRLMATGFYNGSKLARDVLREGINALGSALFPKSTLAKLPETEPGRSFQDEKVGGSSTGGTSDGSLLPCDQVVMRREYLRLVVSFTRMGGDLRHSTIKQTMELLKSLLRDSNRIEPEVEGTILQELLESHFARLSITPKQALSLLREVAPVLRTFALSVDCSGALDAITGALKQPELAKASELVHFIMAEIAGSLVATCSEAALDNILMSLPIRYSVISLLGQLASLDHADVAGPIEQQSPSPGFLCGIVLPLCMIIKTSTEIASENQFQTKQFARKHGLVFVRLLGFVMAACQLKPIDEVGRSSPLPGLHRRGSSRKSSLNEDRMPLATLTIAIQIIKVITIRAADDVSSSFIGMWPRLAKFLKKVLVDGNAQFALLDNASPSPSPWHSPKLTPVSNDPFMQQTMTLDSHSSPLPSQPAHGSRVTPRVVDYLAWSFMEFLCCAPSPLNIQMRSWMQERAAILDSELKAREGPTRSPRKSRRISTSVFAKPRGSSISPDALRASRGLSRVPSELNLSASFSSEFDSHPSSYNRFPSSVSPTSPHQNLWNGPRIVHLGPTKLQRLSLDNPLEDSLLKTLVRTSNIALPALIRMTRYRIRIVQTCLGYDRLLPASGNDGDLLDINLKAWTKTSALALIIEETKLVIEEFPECFREIVGGGFVDVPSTPEPISPAKKPILF